MEIKQITKRLHPGQDLKEELEKIVEEGNIKAGCVASMVGSLSKMTLRIADGKTIKSWDGQFEIVSAIGTVSGSGCHIHISASDEECKTLGGHLKKGCIVKTTVEIVLFSFSDVQYKRVADTETGFDELVVK